MEANHSNAMGSNGVKDYITTTEAMKLLGYTTPSGVQRFLEGARVSKRKVRGSRENMYSRSVVMALGEKQGKLKLPSSAKEIASETPSQVEGEKVSLGSIPAEESSSIPKSGAGLKIGGDWITVLQAMEILNYTSTSGVSGRLRKLKVPYQTTRSSRGVAMKLYKRSDIEAVKQQQPVPLGVGRRRKVDTSSRLDMLNELIAPGTTAEASNDPVLQAIQVLFLEHPRLVEVSANRTTGDVRIVLALEARLNP